MHKSILIVDDSKDDVELLKEDLKKLGLKVYTSMSGQDGLEKTRKLKPDLVLLDLILPDIDGFEVCDQIKNNDALKKTKVIIISVKGDVEKVGKVLHVGADAYVVKTLVGEIPDDLDDKIKAQLDIK
ncbi:MAG: response regulator [Candidatus Omnitrophota bacterium]